MTDTEHFASIDLPDIPALALQLLGDGAARASAPFHLATVASASPAGPRARTVVLRRVEATPPTLMFHTDSRSPKISELQADPRLAWHFYEPELKLQMRLLGEATIHADDALADEQWSRSRPSSRACYGQLEASGEAISAPPEDEPVRDGRANFRVVACRVNSLDWLFLRYQGHRRAHFTMVDGAWHGSWVAP